MGYKTKYNTEKPPESIQSDGSILFTQENGVWYIPPEELISSMIELNKVKIAESKSAKKYYDVKTRFYEQALKGEKSNNINTRTDSISNMSSEATRLADSLLGDL